MCLKFLECNSVSYILDYYYADEHCGSRSWAIFTDSSCQYDSGRFINLSTYWIERLNTCKSVSKFYNFAVLANVKRKTIFFFVRTAPSLDYTPNKITYSLWVVNWPKANVKNFSVILTTLPCMQVEEKKKFQKGTEFSSINLCCRLNERQWARAKIWLGGEDDTVQACRLWWFWNGRERKRVVMRTRGH